MALLFYVRLIGLTAGTLVYLFLLALILGHRRPRLFERLLFFLVLSLFLIYAGGLLEINALIQYGSPPETTRLLYTTLFVLGSVFLPGLVAQVTLEYGLLVHAVPRRTWWWALLLIVYLLPLLGLRDSVLAANKSGSFGLQAFTESYRPQLAIVFVCPALFGAWLSLILTKHSTGSQRRFLQELSGVLFLFSIPVFIQAVVINLPPGLNDGMTVAALLIGIFPGALLIYYSLKHNFLEYGAQRNLVYALSATVLALLYLGLVHRISGWLAPVFPPEATASVLLFVLIFLFEPIERLIGPALHRTLRERMDRWQRLAVELQENARHGDLARLITHAERRIREEFGLASVRVSVPGEPSQKPLESPGGLGHVVRVPWKKGREEIGFLEAASTGSYLTGETSAALEFLAEQLPSAIDLCRLIEEKLALERELAERERLALLGQMAASVSHNLRNPLSSMKTVLQVQLERSDLPADLRHDCALVVGEIDRMSAKLRQLLDFAKPSVNGQRLATVALARQTACLFRHDAERRNVILEFNGPAAEITALASEEALGEVFSNLIVNAIEAQPDGGRVHVALARDGDHLEICIEDTGPGISPELRAKMFQPFYTTKATGTGLGLSIVARRVSEMGGTISCESPVSGGKGARFRVVLPVANDIPQAFPT